MYIPQQSRHNRRVRRKKRAFRLFLMLIVIGAAAFLLLHGCGKSPKTATPGQTAGGQAQPADSGSSGSDAGQTAAASDQLLAKAKEIRVEPSTVILPPNRLVQVPVSQPLKITAVLDDQSEVDIGPKVDAADGTVSNPNGVRFAVSDPSIAKVDGTGIVSLADAANTGDSAKITVSFGKLTAVCDVKVIYSLQDTVKASTDGTMVVTNPTDLDVVVNKDRSLPEGYEPPDLIKPDVPFSFKEESEKKYLRATAAHALEDLFAGAKKDGIDLFGISGYRSYATQKSLFNYYVKVQGKEEASRYSAVPGHSEHQTGLAIDVSSQSAGFQVEDVFGTTKEGEWLKKHCAEYGFIIRYPKGKEAVTGYAYEPWHIRYVGKSIAKDIMSQGITLEEYFSQGTPVSAGK